MIDGKGEERGYGCNDGMAELRGKSMGAGIASGGEQHKMGGDGGAAREIQGEALLSGFLQGLEGMMFLQADAQTLRVLREAIDNGRRTVGEWKDAAIGLSLQGNTMFGEPGYRILGLKTVEGAD